jgi:hypothetical protein
VIVEGGALEPTGRMAEVSASAVRSVNCERRWWNVMRLHRSGIFDGVSWITGLTLMGIQLNKSI